MNTRLALSLACAAAFAIPQPGWSQSADSKVGRPAINLCTPWPGVDGLGRTLPLSEEVGLPKADRFVGIFYFLTHNNYPKNPSGDGPYDIAKILAADHDAFQKPASPAWGGYGTAHYWGEPLFGYYRSIDPWIIRRHAQLLSEAGIDTLIFDTTNAETYPDVYRALCEVFMEMRHAGARTPQVCFMVNTKAGQTAQRLFNDLYQPGHYPELWFRWHGKPLLICDPAEASPEVREFFTLRRAHWPFTQVNTLNAWHWEATYPQAYGYMDDPNQPEEVNVSVAQNLGREDGKVTNMSTGEARGRSFHDGLFDHSPGAINQGFNFQEQWKRVFDLNPPFVMVTGWNEWTAGQWGKPGEPLSFVDQFDEEFSRDIEPMKGGHWDNYYAQLVSNVRRYKGAPALPFTSEPKSIRVTKAFDQWAKVAPEYMDNIGDTRPREFEGVAGLHYTNSTGRNDLVAFKVARDKRNLYFYARTDAPLSPNTGTNWMWLLIDSDQNPATGWEGYNYVINRNTNGKGHTWLEKNEGGWNWKKVTALKINVKGNELQIEVPRSALNLPKNSTKTAIDFKWADNLQRPGDVMDFYVSGDVAPEGRFRFRYNAP